MRPRRSTFYALEETIASLHEELQFTLNYAHAMVQDKNYRAAAEVIEEQRRSLARATKRMEKTMAPEPPVRRQARVRAALVGVAAALALASGAFAAFGPVLRKPTAPVKGVNVVQQANDQLTAATAMTDPLQVQATVRDANQKLLGVVNQHPSDLNVQRSLLESMDALRAVINNPNVPASVRAEARKVAEQVQDVVTVVDETEKTTTETEKKTTTNTETNTDTETSTAPAAEPSV